MFNGTWFFQDSGFQRIRFGFSRISDLKRGQWILVLSTLLGFSFDKTKVRQIEWVKNRTFMESHVEFELRKTTTVIILLSVFNYKEIWVLIKVMIEVNNRAVAWFLSPA